MGNQSRQRAINRGLIRVGSIMNFPSPPKLICFSLFGQFAKIIASKIWGAKNRVQKIWS